MANKCPLNKQQRKAFKKFLKVSRNNQGFVLYFALVQCFISGMLAGGVKSSVLKKTSRMECNSCEAINKVPNNIDLFQYILSAYYGNKPVKGLKECLCECSPNPKKEKVKKEESKPAASDVSIVVAD